MPPGPMPVPGPTPAAALQYMMTPRSTMSITHTKGLLNMPGQNNCFLNSAVQVLWHLDIFRRSFRELTGHMCMAESCIFCALKELFAQFQYSQESALPPDALRRALAETFFDQRRFQLGFMDDAAECFENILLRIHFHIANHESEDMCNSRHCIPHQKFAMTLVEQTVCHACGATSEPLPFTQMVHYVSASALCSQAKAIRGKGDNVQPFGELLRKAGGMGDIRDCPSTCGAKIQIRRNLMNRPEIVSLGIVWDSERPTLEHIMDVFHTIGLTIKLQDVFHSVVDRRWADSAVHQLVGIVTYYGKHYSTFFFHTKLCVWIYFDDATVREIGPRWEQVIEKCRRGHFQPLLLLYSNPYGTPVITSTAPRNVTMAPGHRKNLSEKKSHESGIMEKAVRNPHMHLAPQRRAVTPNPEVSHDPSASVQPRRAMTPSGELARHEELKEYQSSHRQPHLLNGSLSSVSGEGGHNLHSKFSGQSYPKHCIFHSSSSCNPNTCFFYKYLPSYSLFNGQLSNECYNQQTIPHPNTSSVQSQAKKDMQYSNIESADTHSTTSTKYQLPPRPASVDDLLQSISKYSESAGAQDDQNQHCKRSETQAHAANPTDSKVLNEVGDMTESTYISRKAVENVLNLQKLERQKSIKCKHSHPPLGRRTSSSSLESLENALMLREKALKNPLGLKIDIPESANVPRKRDSGNWSGDRNSASSSSSTSLDNPYYFVLGNKRSLPIINSSRCPTTAGKPSYTDHIAVFSDQGYDSFSLSSTDSYPSPITNSPAKLDPRLSLIPENVQTASTSAIIKQLPSVSKEADLKPNGIRADCEKLCSEADIFLTKSVEREKCGDLAMAALLSDTAAAKARAAMDAPYSNSQALVTAKMKHGMCVIRSSNLHRKLKEAQNVEIRKEKEFNGETRHSGQDPIHCKQIHQESKEAYLKQTIDASHNKSDTFEKPGKDIEIYATLPKKGLKKKGNILSLMGTLTSDNNENNEFPSSEQTIQPENNSTPYQTDISSLCTQNLHTTASAHKTSNDKNSFKNSSTKKDFAYAPSKIRTVDSGLNDYGNEWERVKMSPLYRTYSGPPTMKDREFADITKDSLNQTFSSHPSKKQHKIRRKLMGGFMRRKNRSLPDLREGNDPQNSLSCAYDDYAILPVPSSSRTEERATAKTDSSEECNFIVKESCNQNGNASNNIKYQRELHRAPNVSQPGLQKTQSHLTHNQFSIKMKSSNSDDSVTRSETPPPYKPPPPLTSTFTEAEPFYHRNVGRSFPVNKSSKYTDNDSVVTSLPKSQGNFTQTVNSIGHTGQDQMKNFAKPSSPTKMPSDSLMTLGKGAAIWLQELQNKQLLMLQRRKRQQQCDKQCSEDCMEVNAETSTKIPCSVQRTGSQGSSQNMVTDSSCSTTRSSMPAIPKDSDLTDQNRQYNLSEQESIENVDHKPQSVKDLASKFEQILRPPNLLESSLNTINLSPVPHSSSGKTSENPFSTSDTEQYLPSSTVHNKINSSQEQLDRTGKSEPISIQCLASVPVIDSYVYDSFIQPQCHHQNSSLSGNMHLPSLKNSTDGKVRHPQCGLNCHPQNEYNLANVNQIFHLNCANALIGKSELKRPDKPPDYETAIQRLGLIRGDRAHHLSVMSGHHYPRYMEMIAPTLFFDGSKKKRGPKKSVTFSDKVVLVACADEEENDFLPNPLLERVYRQHLQHKCSDDKTDAKESKCVQKNLKSNCCGQMAGQVDAFPQGTNATVTLPCHLCHKKYVVPPTIYCPDCAFYMSRFKLHH